MLLRTLSIASALGITLLLLGNIATASAADPLNYVDPQGNAIDAATIPADFRAAVENLALQPNVGLREGKVGLVLARVVMPSNETDLTFSSSLVAPSRYGGMHYLAPGGVTLPNAAPMKDAVCIAWTNSKDPCSLEIRKTTYHLASTAIATANIQGNVVWAGEIQLQKYDAGAAQVVWGSLTNPDLTPLAAPGDVSIRVNGSPAFSRVKLLNGGFTFPSVYPGNYLVEFWIDDYSAKTLSVTVEEKAGPVEKSAVAYPRFQIALQEHAAAPSNPVTLTCGVAYKDANLPLADTTQLRIDQSGTAIELYSSKHQIVVCSGPFVDNATLLPIIAQQKNPWFSWSGHLSPGQLIVLTDNGSIYTVFEVNNIIPPMPFSVSTLLDGP